jgi:hypothetical protein
MSSILGTPTSIAIARHQNQPGAEEYGLPSVGLSVVGMSEVDSGSTRWYRQSLPVQRLGELDSALTR